LGLEWRRKDGPLKSGLSIKHAFKQTHLALNEVAQTPAYTDVSAVLSYHQAFKNSDLDWYMIAKNLLNQDIRYSTTVETLRLYAPQAARSVSVGVKWNY
jgi:iron complex outermembrane receptor protein